jgi:hypothetical protein
MGLPRKTRWVEIVEDCAGLPLQTRYALDAETVQKKARLGL